MSQYIIIRKHHKTSPYSGQKSKVFYEFFTHVNTKFANNEPYFSSILYNDSVCTKEQLPTLLNLAQNHITSYRRQPKKESKSGHIFVLKLNSPKLQAILALK